MASRSRSSSSRVFRRPRSKVGRSFSSAVESYSESDATALELLLEDWLFDCSTSIWGRRRWLPESCNGAGGARRDGGVGCDLGGDSDTGVCTGNLAAREASSLVPSSGRTLGVSVAFLSASALMASSFHFSNSLIFFFSLSLSSIARSRSLLSARTIRRCFSTSLHSCEF